MEHAMKYPFEVSMEMYYDLDFDTRTKIDQWLTDQGIIPTITKSFKIVSSIQCLAYQYTVTDGCLEREEKWPRYPKITERSFRISTYGFPSIQPQA